MPDPVLKGAMAGFGGGMGAGMGAAGAHMMGMGGGMGTMAQAQAAGSADPSSKMHRDIYVGNVPVGIKGDVLIDFFRVAMEAAGLNTSPANPM